jgi:hypothetical protein
MPARSKKQQMAAGAALSAKRGETPKSKLKGASRDMVETMTEKELRDMASTPREELPKVAGNPAPKRQAGTAKNARAKT